MTQSKKIELQARLEFRKEALSKLRAAYLALLDGGVKHYLIGDRQLTRLDIEKLSKEIAEAEKEVDELESLLAGAARRKAVGMVPRNW